MHVLGVTPSKTEKSYKKFCDSALGATVTYNIYHFSSFFPLEKKITIYNFVYHVNLLSLRIKNVSKLLLSNNFSVTDEGKSYLIIIILIIINNNNCHKVITIIFLYLVNFFEFDFFLQISHT